MAKNYFRKYIWLVQKLQTRKMTFKEINSAWKASSINDDGKEMSARTFHNTKDAIADLFGIQISCDRSTNEYYIADDGDEYGSGLKNWMLETMTLSSLLDECAADRNVIRFEDIPSAKLYLEDVLKAINARKKIGCTYQGHSMPAPYDMTIHPYGLKQYQRKWYMVGKNEYNGEIRQFALDNRMKALTVTDENFIVPSGFSLDEYYRYRIGVLDVSEEGKHGVILKVYSSRVRQIRDLPLHKSQEEIETAGNYSLFRYDVYPNADFISAVLPYGGDVEIVEPVSLREKMKNNILKMMHLYDN